MYLFIRCLEAEYNRFEHSVIEYCKQILENKNIGLVDVEE